MQSAYVELVRMIRDGPGAAAPAAAVRILRTMSDWGYVVAGMGLGHALADQLGSDITALEGATSLDEIARRPAVGPLVRAYALGLQPRLLVAASRDSTLAGPPPDDADLSAVQRLVAMHSPLQDEALRAFLLGAALPFLRTRPEMPPSFALDLADRIMGAARVVDGDDAHTGMEFGRDLILSAGGAGRLLFTVHHEFGHLDLDARIAGASPSTWMDDRVAAWNELAARLPSIVAAARAAPGAPVRSEDPRAWRPASGLWLTVTEEVRPLGSYLHASLTDGGATIDPRAASGLARRLVQTLGAAPDSAAAAFTRKGKFHVGVAVTDLGPGPAAGTAIDPPAAQELTAEEMDGAGVAWYAGLVEHGRVGRNSGELQYLLGVAGREPLSFAGSDRYEDDMHADATSRGQDLSGRSPVSLAGMLAVAVRCGDSEWAERLLAAGGTADWPGLRPVPLDGLGASCAVRLGDGEAELIGAPLEGLLRMIWVLGPAGFDLSGPVNDRGDNLLTEAAGRSPALTSALLRLGFGVDVPNRQGQTALAVAAQFGRLETVRTILAAGGRTDVADGDGWAPLHVAANRGDAEMASLLLDHGAPVDSRTASGSTALALSRRGDVSRVLCQKGADVGSAHTAGITPLIAAAGRGDLDAVNVLIGAGADVDAADQLGGTALHAATQAPRDTGTIMAALVAAGAAVDEEDDRGMTPLMGAARAADPAAVEFLLAHGAKPEARSQEGTTPLMFACDPKAAGRLDFDRPDRVSACIRRLVSAGAQVDTRNDAGETALLRACSGFEIRPVATLLELGADPDLASDNGATPLGLAGRHGLGGVEQALRAAGAKDPGPA